MRHTSPHTPTYTLTHTLIKTGPVICLAFLFLFLLHFLDTNHRLSNKIQRKYCAKFTLSDTICDSNPNSQLQITKKLQEEFSAIRLKKNSINNLLCSFETDNSRSNSKAFSFQIGNFSSKLRERSPKKLSSAMCPFHTFDV